MVDTMNRAILVMHALGQQGGTVHDLCRDIGLDVQRFLYPSDEDAKASGHSVDYDKGWFAARTSPDYLKSKAIENFRGNLQFWLGVARGQELKEKGI